jgi:hypothetical protein
MIRRTSTQRTASARRSSKDTLSVLRGQLPRRALALVLEWAALHRAELRVDWNKAGAGELPLPIDPLD